jgi:hypothetical protein
LAADTASIMSPLFDPLVLAGDADPTSISAANDGVERLRARLVDEIAISHLPWLIIPCNVQVFFQGQLRRALMFVEGRYDAYLARRGLVVYSCARAIYETFACVMDFCDKLTDHLASGDFEKTCAFIHSRQHAAKLEDLVGKELLVNEILDNTAVNILTQINRVSKHFPGFRDDYELLSERMHPNGLGALHHFGESGDDVIKFSNSNKVERDHAIRNLLSAAKLLVFMDHGMKVMEAKLAKHRWLKPGWF